MVDRLIEEVEAKIRKFFLNDCGSIHDLLEHLNNDCEKNYGLNPIGVRSLQLFLKKLQDEGDIKLTRFFCK